MPQKKPSSDSSPPAALGIVDMIINTIESSYRDISAIISARIDLAKLDLAEIIASVLASAVIGLIGLIGLAYLMVALALFLGEVLGKPSLGFFIMGMILSGLAVYLAKVSPDLLKNFFWRLVFTKLDELERQRSNTNAGT
ncbi:MAG: phage holin family protein [Chloroherpetonaceae bacterium]|nr:phage holin family protein [Chloroherpetonaceae bacterium]